MEKMVVQYGEQAKEAGVYIVSACGFDCIPNDLGALVLQRNFEGELAYVESYMTTDSVSFVASVLKGLTALCELARTIQEDLQHQQSM